MTDRSKQPAVMQRRIDKLEALLAAEKEASEKVWHGYRDALYRLVVAEQKLKDIQAVLRGDE